MPLRVVGHLLSQLGLIPYSSLVREHTSVLIIRPDLVVDLLAVSGHSTPLFSWRSAIFELVILKTAVELAERVRPRQFAKVDRVA